MIRNIPGNILECGVAGGDFLFSMAHFSSIYEPHHYTRKVIGFDTFEGFTEPSAQDLTSSAQHMRLGGLSYHSYEYLNEAIKLYGENRMIGNVSKVSLHKEGYFRYVAQISSRPPFRSYCFTSPRFRSLCAHKKGSSVSCPRECQKGQLWYLMKSIMTITPGKPLQLWRSLVLTILT